MPSGYNKVYALCPFYKSDNGKEKRITCEGITERSNLELVFRTRDDFEQQMQIFCSEHYKNCEVYRMLMNKYEEG